MTFAYYLSTLCFDHLILALIRSLTWWWPIVWLKVEIYCRDWIEQLYYGSQSRPILRCLFLYPSTTLVWKDCLSWVGVVWLIFCFFVLHYICFDPPHAWVTEASFNWKRIFISSAWQVFWNSCICWTLNIVMICFQNSFFSEGEQLWDLSR